MRVFAVFVRDEAVVLWLLVSLIRSTPAKVGDADAWNANGYPKGLKFAAGHADNRVRADSTKGPL